MHSRILFTARSCLLAVIIIITVFTLFSCQKKTDTLTIWCYDSFATEWGTGPSALKLFEEKTGIKAELLAQGDAGQLLSRAMDEKGKSGADIILGIDNNLMQRAIDAGILSAYKPAGISAVQADKILDPEYRLIPYDWGAFAFIWDRERLDNPPGSLAELTSSQYSKKIILMDPRTSTPGLGFLAWTMDVYGEGLKDYWKALKPSILSMAPGWDMGYGLFTKGEAPLVLSYTTSPAYHAEYEESGRYLALIFPEGHPVQIELAGILAGAAHRKEAEAFMDFLLSPEFQALIPLSNWMYPVIDIELPESYNWAPKPEKLIYPDPASLNRGIETALEALGN